MLILILLFNFLSLGVLQKTKENASLYTTVELIESFGYPAEEHSVITADGFILKLHRIPYSYKWPNVTNRQPVFLQHGLLMDSSHWILVGNRSLAFMLSDTGYDVWLGNARGNKYSRSHTKYSPQDSAFWNFSWHEMGVYDLPAALEYVGRSTGKMGEIIYIGHSMGTTMFFVYSSIYTNASDVVKTMVALAPAAYMTDIKSPVKFIGRWVTAIEWTAKNLGLNEFLPSNRLLDYLGTVSCEASNDDLRLCRDLIFMIVGFDEELFDLDLLPTILNYTPSGTSTKTFVHYCQGDKFNGNFQQYDYGPTKNLIRYGTVAPPSYNISQIRIPMFIISSTNDWLVGPKAVQDLLKGLTNDYTHYIIPIENFNHIDFLWAKNIDKLLYKSIVKYIKNFK